MGWQDITHLKTRSRTFSSTPYHPLGVKNLNCILKGFEKHRAIEKRDFHAGSSRWAQPSLWAWAVVLLLDRPQRPVYAVQGSVCCPCLNNEEWFEVLTWSPHPPPLQLHALDTGRVWWPSQCCLGVLSVVQAPWLSPRSLFTSFSSTPSPVLKGT